MVATIVGLIGITPTTVIETFVAPDIGHAAMEHLEAGGMGTVDAVFGLAYLGGALTLGWALWRAHVGIHWIGPPIIAAAVALLGSMAGPGRLPAP